LIISEMQHKLATWAEAGPNRRFDRLLRLIADREWLAEAARIVLASSGCAAAIKVRLVLPHLCMLPS